MAWQVGEMSALNKHELELSDCLLGAMEQRKNILKNFQKSRWRKEAKS